MPHMKSSARMGLDELRAFYGSDTAPMERRTVVIDRAETRASSEDGADTFTFEGHAAVFDKRSEDLGFFEPVYEVIKRGAFKDAIKRDDVRFLINHDGIPLARTKSGTLNLSEDPRGLLTVADLDKRQGVVNDMFIALERGDLDQMSFGFRMGPGSEQTFTEDDEGNVIRTITRVGELFDVSVVTFPAYPDSDAGIRQNFIPIVAPSGAEQDLVAVASEPEIQAAQEQERADEPQQDDEAWRAASRRRRLRQHELLLKTQNRS